MRQLWLTFVLATACTGTIAAPGAPSGFDPSGGPGDPSQPSGAQPPVDACAGVTIAAAPSVLRRLTVEQQLNSYRDVMSDPSVTLDLAAQVGPVITEIEVEKLNLAAHALVQRNGHQAYLTCGIDGAFDDACAQQFIADFGRRVFRRALTADEQAGFKSDVYDAMRADAAIVPPATFHECIDALAESILQSGQYVYIHEDGVADPSLPVGIRRLSGNERAVRLSYLLWNSTPDAALLDAAEAGQLDTADGVRTQAQRLLADPKARAAVRTVVAAWLQLDGNSHQASLETAPKDATLFPFDGAPLRAAMREEVLSLYEKVFFDLGGGFSTLMTSPKAYVNRSLGQLYGVTQGLPSSDAESAWVDLDPTQRAGLFTRAAFLMLYSPQTQESPIRRGVFLLRDLLGQSLGTPPPNVDQSPLKPASDALTVRQQVEARTAPASCQACHGRINPLGFTLGNYDAMGRYVTQESGTLDGTPYTAPVDADANIIDTDLKGDVNGPLALSSGLAKSAEAHDTMARVWFARANERQPVATDACSLQRLTQGFRQSDDMRDLVLSLTVDDNALFIQETP